jgi:hypothetical protein
MKTFVVVGVFIFLLFSLSISEVLVQEDFTDAAFPPDGWSTKYLYTGGSWNWTDSGQTGNGYAHGQVVLNSPYTQGVAMLSTYYFTLNQGSTIHITFDRRNNWTGVQPESCAFEMDICEGGQMYYGMIVPIVSTWTSTEFTQNINMSSDEWSILWRIDGLLQQTSPSTLYFDVDNVFAETYGVTVEPTSLGSLKAVFH